MKEGANMLTNKTRGEAVAQINGRPVRLLLSLDALAKLETEWQTASMVELNARLFPPKVVDMKTIVVALSEAAGNPVTAEEAGKIAGPEIVGVIQAIAATLDMGDQAPKKPEPPATTKKPARSPGRRGSRSR